MVKDFREFLGRQEESSGLSILVSHCRERMRHLFGITLDVRVTASVLQTLISQCLEVHKPNKAHLLSASESWSRMPG